MRSLLVLSVAIGILVLAGRSHASAQIVDPVEFTTSFPFTVAKRRYLRAVHDQTKRRQPRDPLPDGANTSVLFPTDSAETRETPSKTEVVFKRYGDGYVLKETLVEGQTRAPKLACRG